MEGARAMLVIEAECRDTEISFGTLGRAPCSPEALERIVKRFSARGSSLSPPGPG